MKLPDLLISSLLGISLQVAIADQYYGGNKYYQADDGGRTYGYYNGDDGGVGEYYTSGGATYSEYKGDYNGSDYIKYWTEYAVMPKKCITYNHKDMIVFSMYEKYYNHCKDKPIGTYMTDVPTFISAWVNQLDLNSEDVGGDDYVSPDTTFVNCYPYETNNGVYYVQLGCTDGDSQSLSVNVYKDNTCETPDKNEHGMDDTYIDVSSLQPPFKSCHQCVYFVDKNEDDTDDAYFDNRMTNAPLCSGVWESKSKCDSKCKRLGGSDTGSWNKSDKTLLTILSAFGAIMLGVILKKRSKMAKKDSLLEEAAMSAAGIQQTHVIGIFVITLIVITLFGLLGLKTITWTLLLLLNLVLFSYVMKLTIDSGFNVPLGPDGQPIEDDSSDDEDDDDEYEDEEGDYKPPNENLPPIT
jgi:hypothetical protein